MIADASKHETPNQPLIRVEGLELRYGDTLVQRDLDFEVRRGEVFLIMGGSGCGKSTLLKHLIGLYRPAAGRVIFSGVDLWEASDGQRQKLMRNIGVLYQQGALLSSQTLAENIAIPLREYSRFSRDEIREIAEMKLALVGLRGFGDAMPTEISGGMRKRAALARAMAMDPEILFFDEPTAGLDPVNARQLDELILEVSRAMDTTVVMVTHELASIFDVGTDSIFLDDDTKTIIGHGPPRTLLKETNQDKVREFLTRGGRAGSGGDV